MAQVSSGSGKKTKLSWSFIKDPIKKIKTSQRLNKARSLLGTAAELAQVVNDMGPTPSLRNYAALATMVMSKLVSGSEVDPNVDHSFVNLWPGPFQKCILKVCEKHSSLQRVGNQNGSDMQMVQLGEEVLILSGPRKEKSFYYLSRDVDGQESRVWQAIGRALWETYGPRLTLQEAERWEKDIRIWKIGQDHFQSPQTTDLLARTQKFLQAGVSRSVLLHGAPGVGKSCMARTMAHELHRMTLFIDASQIKNLDAGMLEMCLDILHPAVVIIDDLDCIFDVKSLLSAIDRIRSSAQLFLVTANDKNAFDAAVIRAGRFDEVIEVERLVKARDLVPDLTDALYDEIDVWPASFLNELKLRLEVLGPDVLDDELERLRPRVAENTLDRLDRRDEAAESRGFRAKLRAVSSGADDEVPDGA